MSPCHRLLRTQAARATAKTWYSGISGDEDHVLKKIHEVHAKVGDELQQERQMQGSNTVDVEKKFIEALKPTDFSSDVAYQAFLTVGGWSTLPNCVTMRIDLRSITEARCGLQLKIPALAAKIAGAACGLMHTPSRPSSRHTQLDVVKGNFKASFFLVTTNFLDEGGAAARAAGKAPTHINWTCRSASDDEFVFHNYHDSAHKQNDSLAWQEDGSPFGYSYLRSDPTAACVSVRVYV